MYEKCPGSITMNVLSNMPVQFLKMDLHPFLGFRYVWTVRTGHSSDGQTNGNAGETKIYV